MLYVFISHESLVLSFSSGVLMESHHREHVCRVHVSPRQQSKGELNESCKHFVTGSEIFLSIVLTRKIIFVKGSIKKKGGKGQIWLNEETLVQTDCVVSDRPEMAAYTAAVCQSRQLFIFFLCPIYYSKCDFMLVSFLSVFLNYTELLLIYYKL